MITDLQVGGEATILSWLLPKLTEHGIESLVIVLAPNVHKRFERSTPVIAHLRANGIRVVDLEATSFPYFPAIARLAVVLRSFRPHIVHTYLFHAGLLGRTVARIFTRAKIVSSVVNVDAWKTGVASKLDAVSLRTADRILVNAQAVASRLLADSPALRELIVLQYNGVDFAHIRDAPPGHALVRRLIPGYAGQPLLGVIGRLHRAKAPDNALRVFERLSRRHPNLHAIFVGAGPLDRELKSLAVQLEIAHRTWIVGALSHQETIAVMKAVDLILVASRWEGLPAVVLEALAAGTPVVATKVGGMAEVLTEEENGLLAAEGDLEGLAEHCARVLFNQRLRGHLVEGGLRTAKDLSLEATAGARVALYRALANEPDRSV